MSNVITLHFTRQADERFTHSFACPKERNQEKDTP